MWKNMFTPSASLLLTLAAARLEERIKRGHANKPAALDLNLSNKKVRHWHKRDRVYRCPPPQKAAGAQKKNEKRCRLAPKRVV